MLSTEEKLSFEFYLKLDLATDDARHHINSSHFHNVLWNRVVSLVSRTLIHFSKPPK